MDKLYSLFPMAGSKNQKKSNKLTFHIISLFPGAFDSYLGESILKRALEDKKIAVKFYNPRDFTMPTGKRVVSKKGKDGKVKKVTKKVWTYADRRVDDKAYGGGPGMVIEALPVVKAIEKAVGKKLAGINKKGGKNSVRIIFFSPSGKLFDTDTAKSIANPTSSSDAQGSVTDIVFVCGRYEGIDARVKSIFKMEDISVGPFVLTGGELPAMIMMDCIARQIPGVLGDIASLEETRTASPDVYTRPDVFEYKKKKYRVPPVLLSGNHALIEAWRKEQLNKGMEEA